MSAPFAGPAGSMNSAFATNIGRDRLIRQEVSLGLIRELVPPEGHIGLSIAPMMAVPTDDVIFNYAKGFVDGLAPARAEDAESEMAQKDDVFYGEGRASVIDWAVKDHYSPSDVSRYREWLTIQEKIRDTAALPLTVDSMTSEFQARVARDTVRRRRKLDNRLEWLIMTQALSTGVTSYNDGKVKFTVTWGRPAGQQALTPATIPGNTGSPVLYNDSSGNHDPIRDLLAAKQYMFDTYGVRMTRAITSAKVLNTFMNANKFAQRTGVFVSNGSGGIATGDMNYVADGWGPRAAIDIVQANTEIQFTAYDSVYRTRPVNSQTVTANRFFPQNRILLLPDEGDLNEFDDTQIGFAKTLTSPHPANNWSPGWYEWETDYGSDPWGHDFGTGIKAFPVFPHMDLTMTIDVLP